MRRIAIAMTALLLTVMVLVPTVGSASPEPERLPIDDTREVQMPKDAKLVKHAPGLAREVERLQGRSVRAATVGDTKFWLGYDFFNDVVYVKEYTLRGVGAHAEIWVASDSDSTSTALEFPAGDCRNDDGVRTVVTDDQIQYLLDELDGNIYPRESDLYSVAPPRDGMDAPLADLLALPPDYYAGDGDQIVVLVDNFRDDNFYDTDNANTYSYVAGFYWGLYDFYLNRLVMNIDGWDWLHRTGDDPPNEPSTDPCTHAPARPNLYEGTFAHEYQHLLEAYEDWDEVAWVNEGLSMYAEPATGYGDWTLSVNDVGFEGSVQCFLGHIVKATPVNVFPFPGGPENSLTAWGDQTDDQSEILCDYGAAGTFVGYLAQQFGEPFVSKLHRNARPGLRGLQFLLNKFEDGLDAGTVIDRWAAMVAIDKWLDQGANLVGTGEQKFQLDLIRGAVNWSTDQAYENPGAPPNGSDYVRFRNGLGEFLPLSALRNIGFDGVSELPAMPVEWTVDEAEGSPAPSLYSGDGDNLDRAIIQEVDVGAGVLTFDTSWNTEAGYDYAYVQVSTDAGETYDSVSCDDSVPAPLGVGFDGSSGGWVSETCDLSPWAGQTVLLSFRYVTDGGVIEPGFWVDDVDVDGTALTDGSTLDGWSSMTEINPTDAAFTVRLLGYNADGGRVHLAKLVLDGKNDGSMTASEIDHALGKHGDLAAAIVTFHEPTELALQTASYTLTVNGTVQPGGA
ncbi:MAG TPA: peptidase M6 [Actinomycetota bacterium]|nr:peptidase M6 [Actinomycetota bacterium]